MDMTWESPIIESVRFTTVEIHAGFPKIYPTTRTTNDRWFRNGGLKTG